MHKPRFSLIDALAAMGRISAGPMAIEGVAQKYHLAAGRNYVSRSRYVPGGSRRNCGDRGISPKKLRRAQT